MNPQADQQDPQPVDLEPTSMTSVDLEPTSTVSVDSGLASPESLEIELVEPVSVDPASVDLVALQAGATTGRDAGIAAAPAAGAGKTAKRRAGVPVWRTGKPDAFLAAAVDTARTAIAGITAASDIGPHLAAKSEGDRLVTHLFECRLPGYAGWQWFAVVTRNSRSKVVTINELGLLPSEDSILAPEWVPWAERVRPEDEQEQDLETGGHHAGEPEAGPLEPGGPQAEEPEAGTDQADTAHAAAAEPADGDAAAREAVGVMDGEDQDGQYQDGEAEQGAALNREAGNAEAGAADAGVVPEQRTAQDATN